VIPADTPGLRGAAMRPVRERRFGAFDAMCAAGIVLVAFLAYVGVCRANSREFVQLAVRTNEAAAEAAQLDEVRAALETAETRTEKVKARLALLHKRIPDDLDMDGFLREINEVATQNNVLIVNVRPGEVSEQDSYRQAPVAVDATGRFKNVYTFINALRVMPRLTNIEGIKIEVDEDRLCRISLTLSIYAYRDNSDEIQE